MLSMSNLIVKLYPPQPNFQDGRKWFTRVGMIAHADKELATELAMEEWGSEVRLTPIQRCHDHYGKALAEKDITTVGYEVYA